MGGRSIEERREAIEGKTRVIGIKRGRGSYREGHRGRHWLKITD